jgi:RNA polymerase sigma-70 factor (ECF subfamily)
MEIDLETTLRLARSAKTGNRAAMNDLFARYLPRVRQIAALRLGRRVRDFAEIEDIVQDAFVKALRGFERFEPVSVGAFRNWLVTCVVSAIVDRERARRALKRDWKRERSLANLEYEPLSSALFPSKIAADRELEEKLEAAILELSPRYREAVILRYLCEMTPAEVATVMGFADVQNARNAYHRALKKLRSLLPGDLAPS